MNDTLIKSTFTQTLLEIEKTKQFYFPKTAIKELISTKKIIISDGTLSQYILEAEKKRTIFAAGRGWYSSIKQPFALNKKPIKNTISILSKKFPYLNFSCWSTEQVNSYAQHLMNQFVTFVYIESDSIAPVSEHLQNLGYSVYADPGKSALEDLFRMFEKTVIIRKAISKQPDAENHAAPIEKVLVDLVWESQKVPFIDKTEARIICNNAVTSARINMAELLGYAKRRKLNFTWLEAIN